MDHDPHADPAGETITPELVCELTRSSPLITVIGDIILDSWMQGQSSRLAREAPVPVVEQGEETLSPGGAANTAMNLASLGARVRLLGVVGDDESGRAVRGLLAEAGVDVSQVLVSAELTTTKKTRIVVDDHIMLRLDAVPAHELPRSEREDLSDRLCTASAAAAADSDALVIADYGGPVHATELPRRLAAIPARPLTIVDAHEPEHWRNLHPSVVTPNVHEVEQTLHASFRTERHRVTLAQKYAPALREATNSDSLVITLDRDGAVAVDEANAVHVTRAQPVPENRASGAGDTFVAGLALALSAGCSLAVASEFAQLAANVVVHKEGTSLCSSTDLLELVGPDHRLRDENGADGAAGDGVTGAGGADGSAGAAGSAGGAAGGVGSGRAGPGREGAETSGRAGDAANRRGAQTRRGRRTVLALGPFDPRNPADRHALEAARALGDFLVVAQSAPAADIATLSADPHVDVVTSCSADVAAVIETVRPDVIALVTAKKGSPRPAEITLRFSHLDIEVVDLSRSPQAHHVVKEAR